MWGFLYNNPPTCRTVSKMKPYQINQVVLDSDLSLDKRLASGERDNRIFKKIGDKIIYIREKIINNLRITKI